MRVNRVSGVPVEGVLESVAEERQLLPNGITVPCVTVVTEKGERLVVPALNVQITGSNMRSQEVFRQNLKVLMAKSGLKVKDLADMVGLSPSYLSLILSGERQNLKDFHKDAIALALGTTVSSLYTPDSSQPAAFTARPSPVPGRDRDISAFEELTRVMNVGDDALLSALYRELNSLSDDEVHRFGQVIRAALISWQESAARRAADASAAPSGLRDRGVTEPEGVPSPGARLTAEQRSSWGLSPAYPRFSAMCPLPCWR